MHIYFKKSASGHMNLLYSKEMESLSNEFRVRGRIFITQWGGLPDITKESLFPLSRIYKINAEKLDFSKSKEWPYPTPWPENEEGMEHVTVEEINQVFGLNLQLK